MKLVEGKEKEYDNYVKINQPSIEDTVGYGKGVVDYGERWADIMESEIEQGKKLEDIAKETSHEADTEGLTGFMYGCAVQALAHFWIHGEKLRRWHNQDWGVKPEDDKGGVVNPALVNINMENL